jgi:hypothetical protein
MATPTFGAKIEIWTGAAYVLIAGANQIKNPRIQMDDPLPVLTQDMTDGIATLVHPKTYKWSDGSCTLDQIPADAGQVALIAAAAGTALTKFKFTRVGVAAVIVNAFVKIEDGEDGVNGLQTISVTFQCSGASPVS